MTIKHTKLHGAVTLALALMATGALAQQAQSSAPTCGVNAECAADGTLLLRVRTRGEEKPLTKPEVPEKSASLQPDRRVTVQTQPLIAAAKPGEGTLAGRWSIQLPDAGIIWATEDPQIGKPQLSVATQGFVPFEAGRLLEGMSFTGYTNYAAFIERAEVVIFDARDSDRTTPLAHVPLTLGPLMEGKWDGVLNGSTHLRAGDALVYVVRAWGANGSMDETLPQRIDLLRSADANAARTSLRTGAGFARVAGLTEEAAKRLNLIQVTYGGNALVRQNIPIRGSRVRVQGRNVAEGASLAINGQSIPVDMERKFVAEYLLPVGQHAFAIEVRQANGKAASARMDVDVSGRYFFGAAMADLTFSRGHAARSVSASAAEDLPHSRLDEGRLAFYLKGKFGGKYLLTAQADTREMEISRMFRGFWSAEPRDIFRRLDPDQYYPVYGDDSTVYRDVDSMGKAYLRLEWDQNQALWGNYATGFTGTEFIQYQRSLYGAALSWRSRLSTANGEPSAMLKVFGSQTQSAAGHSEFLGTGGSLYYLKHTDLLRGSDHVVLEVRDPVTGRVESRVGLIRGADYQIDELQGRLILQRPLAQMTRENMRTLTRDTPLDGYAQVLLVDYEYVPRGFVSERLAAGFRGKYWFGDHLAVGATHVQDDSADAYRMSGADVTIQAGRGTYLKLEAARSRATSAPVFYSDNGGMSFQRTNPIQPGGGGDARAVEARLNARELGWTRRDWTAAGWWRRLDAGYSVARLDSAVDVTERGLEALGDVTDTLRVFGRVSDTSRGTESLRQVQVTADWRVRPTLTLSGELRRVQEERLLLGAASATLLALRYQQQFGASQVYAIGQYTLGHSERYRRNDALILGARHSVSERASVGGEVTVGNRGHALQANGEWRVGPDHTFYGAYTYSTDNTAYDPLFNRRNSGGWTLGQRWRVSNAVNLFNETQFLKASTETGLSHTFGMDFYPAQGWNSGFTLQEAELEKAGGVVERRAISLHAGRTSQAVQWQSRLEYRRDTGLEQRRQWVSTNWLTWKLSESLRWAARLNYSDTTDRQRLQAGARFVEGNAGFAWRPWNTTRYGLFGRYTYLLDVSTLDQVGPSAAQYDQRSHVISLEGVYHPNHNWEFAAKAALRRGEVRMGRLQGQWQASDARFGAVQARYGIGNTDWNLLGEYRWLGVRDAGIRRGALLGVDRDITQNFRVGIGYNFSGFSDNLTDFSYRHRGFFLNLMGRY